MGKMFFSVFCQTQKHVFFGVLGQPVFFSAGRFIINITITLS